jgi:hypothetical protein
MHYRSPSGYIKITLAVASIRAMNGGGCFAIILSMAGIAAAKIAAISRAFKLPATKTKARTAEFISARRSKGRWRMR